jgi:hypothetical protein
VAGVAVEAGCGWSRVSVDGGDDAEVVAGFGGVGGLRLRRGRC